MLENKESNAMEIYKVAFERLQFQDDYIFKFSALFITINGAIGYSWKAAYIDKLSYFLAPLAILGLIVCITWYLWIKHNDYWHSVWIGCLRKIELGLINGHENLELFNAKHENLASGGKRYRPPFRGHLIASILPVSIGIGWMLLLILNLCQLMNS